MHKNVMFDFHAYDQWLYGGSARVEDFLTKVQEKNLVVLAGEYGPDNHSGNIIQSVKNLHAVAPKMKVGRVAWHWFGGDGNDFTTSGNGGGWNINNNQNPTNLSEFGKIIWDDARVNARTPGITATVDSYRILRVSEASATDRAQDKEAIMFDFLGRTFFSKARPGYAGTPMLQEHNGACYMKIPGLIQPVEVRKR